MDAKDKENDKKPLINVVEESKIMLSESSEAPDQDQGRNPDALESFAAHYSMKRPSKKLKNKK